MDLMTMNEAAARVRLSRGAIYANLKRGRFPVPAHLGGRVMFDRGEVEAWLAARFAARGAAEGAPADAVGK